MQIRTAVPTDLQEIVKIEAECFPAAEAATGAAIWTGAGAAATITGAGAAAPEPRRMHRLYASASILNSVRSWSLISLTIVLISSIFMVRNSFLVVLYYFPELNLLFLEMRDQTAQRQEIGIGAESGDDPDAHRCGQ